MKTGSEQGFTDNEIDDDSSVSTDGGVESVDKSSLRLLKQGIARKKEAQRQQTNPNGDKQDLPQGTTVVDSEEVEEYDDDFEEYAEDNLTNSAQPQQQLPNGGEEQEDYADDFEVDDAEQNQTQVKQNVDVVASRPSPLGDLPSLNRVPVDLNALNALHDGVDNIINDEEARTREVESQRLAEEARQQQQQINNFEEDAEEVEEDPNIDAIDAEEQPNGGANHNSLETIEEVDEDQEVNDEDLEKTLARVTEETIKIDPKRATLFKEAQQVFAQVEGDERTAEQRQQQLQDFIDRDDVGEMAQNDTSFGVFAKIAMDVMGRSDDQVSKEDKDKFLKEITEKFGYLGEEDVDPANKEDEQVKMFEVYANAQENEKFGDIVIARFQEAFGPMIQAFKDNMAVEASEQDVEKTGVDKKGTDKKGADKKGKDGEVVEEGTDQKQLKQNKEISERDEKEKQDQKVAAAKAKGKLLLEELTASDIGKGALAITTIIVCSVMLPGVGTALAFAAVSAAYVATSKGKPEPEKEEKEVDQQQASADAAIAAAIERGRRSAAGTAMSGVTKKFVDENSEVLKAEEEKLRKTAKTLSALDKGGTDVDKIKTETVPEPVSEPVVEEHNTQNTDSVDPELEALSEEQKATLAAAKAALSKGSTTADGLEGSDIADDPNKSRETEL